MTTPRFRVLWAVAAGIALAPRPASAQTPVYVTPAPRYVYAQPATRYVYARPAPRYVYARPQSRYVYSTQPRYYAPTTAFGRYRRAVDAGRDPNWATGRGVPYFKPWEY